VFVLAQCFDDEAEVEEAEEENIEILEAGEDSAEALEPAKAPLDLISLPVEGAVVVPRLLAVGFGWKHRNHAEIKHELLRASFRAPVPSGCTLIEVESTDPASSLMQRICSTWSFSKTWSEHRYRTRLIRI
jgi:hypothetical protein